MTTTSPMDLKACLQLLLMLLAPLALLLSPRRRNQQALEQLGRDLLAELRDLHQSPAPPPLADRPLPVPPPQEPRPPRAMRRQRGGARARRGGRGRQPPPP